MIVVVIVIVIVALIVVVIVPWDTHTHTYAKDDDDFPVPPDRLQTSRRDRIPRLPRRIRGYQACHAEYENTTPATQNTVTVIA